MIDRNIKNKPFCECHGLSKIWENDQRKRSGGFWRCSVKSNRRRYRDNNSIKGYIRKRKYILNKMREENLLRLKQLQEENPWLTN